MIKTLLFVLILLCEKSFSESLPINEIRLLYQKAAENEEANNQLILVLTEKTYKDNPLFTGYKASATILSAKYAFNPFIKWSHFLEGKEMLEQVILEDKDNVELRFLRFSIQTNIPSFLGYHNNIEDDKSFIFNSIKTLSDNNLKITIISFLKHSGHITDLEIKKLQNG